MKITPDPKCSDYPCWQPANADAYAGKCARTGEVRSAGARACAKREEK